MTAAWDREDVRPNAPVGPLNRLTCWAYRLWVRFVFRAGLTLQLDGALDDYERK